jgi:hypothetical protein
MLETGAGLMPELDSPKSTPGVPKIVISGKFEHYSFGRYFSMISCRFCQFSGVFTSVSYRQKRSADFPEISSLGLVAQTGTRPLQTVAAEIGP